MLPASLCPPTPCIYFFIFYYHTNFCSNLTIFQFYHTFNHTFYHKFYHKPLPVLPSTPPPPQRFLYLRETQANVLRGLANILRGMQSSVPKRNTGKCLLTVGTDVKNMTEGRGGEGREGGGEGREGGDQARFFMWIN